MKLRVLILCALIVCGRMQGQTDAKLASLAGRGMKKAVIELIAGQGDEAASYTAVSGADGEFQVDGIQPGRYHILIERTGFVFVDAKHHHSDATIVCLEDGQALTGQVFRMLPTAVLTGRVLDEDGDPMNGADVTIFQRLPGSEGRWKQVT